MLAGVFPFEEVQATLEGEYFWPNESDLVISKSVKALVGEIFECNPDLRLTIDQVCCLSHSSFVFSLIQF